jgi:hypothetical protein
MPQNGQYLDSELESINVLKVVNISKVAITNYYWDLSNIPNKFKPAYHNDIHPVISETSDGLVNIETQKILNQLTSTIQNISIQFTPDSSQSFLGYKTINKTWNVTEDEDVSFAIQKGKQMELSVDDDNNINIDVTPIDVSKLTFTKGDDGDKGKNGEDSIVWKPYLDSNGNLAWLKASSNDNIKNLNGEKGKVYFPQVSTVNGQSYLSFILVDVDDIEYSVKHPDIGTTFKGEAGKDGNDGYGYIFSIDDLGNLIWEKTDDAEKLNDFNEKIFFDSFEFNKDINLHGRNGRHLNLNLLSNLLTNGIMSGSSIKTESNLMYKNIIESWNSKMYANSRTLPISVDKYLMTFDDYDEFVYFKYHIRNNITATEAVKYKLYCSSKELYSTYNSTTKTWTTISYRDANSVEFNYWNMFSFNPLLGRLSYIQNSCMAIPITDVVILKEAIEMYSSTI